MRWMMFRTPKEKDNGLPSGEPLYDGVPLHRTYGQRRRERRIRDYAVTVFAGSVLFYILAVLAFALLAIITAILTFIDILVATVFVLVAGSFVLLALTKTLRKRRKFERRLKKLCKKNGYKISKENRGMRLFRWSCKSPSFILFTEGYEYYVHYLTVGHYNSSMVFQSKNEIQLTKFPLNNPFTTIVGSKPKTISLKCGFEELADVEEIKRKRVILVNPVCREMYAKSRDGGVVATGNGFSQWGFTVYTGSGFCEAVERDREEYLKLKTKI